MKTALCVERLTDSLEKLTLSKPKLRFKGHWNCNQCGERQLLAQFVMETAVSAVIPLGAV